MKKIALIAAALALVSLLTLTACDTNSNAGDDTTAGTTADTTSAATNEESTSAPQDTTEAPSGKITYKVTVVDQNGAPVADADVQICTDETCFMPDATDATGLVSFSLQSGVTYKAKLAGLPDGYTGDTENYVNFPADSTELTITVTKN